MSEFNQSLLIANTYRLLLILPGICFGYWGYRLFDKGYFEKGGELKASIGGWHLVLKQVWPGVFFAVIGVVIIWAGVAREISISLPGVAGTSIGLMKKDKPCEKAEIEKYDGQGYMPYRKDGTDTVPKK